jgi:uncharacterized protein
MIRLVGITFGLALVAAAAWLWWFQKTQVYRFESSPGGPEALGIDGLTILTFRSEDGQEVRIWYVPPKDDAPVILVFGGNFSTIAGSVDRVRAFAETGFGLAVLEYRGFENDAEPSEAALTADARALYDQLDALTGNTTSAERRVLHGFSLGTGLAVRLATERPVGAVVLEAPFASLTDYFTARFRGLPMNRLMWRERWDNVPAISALKIPILVLRGKNDGAIPAWSFEALVRALPPQAQVVVFPDGGHADLQDWGGMQVARGFLRENVSGVP